MRCLTCSCRLHAGACWFCENLTAVHRAAGDELNMMPDDERERRVREAEERVRGWLYAECETPSMFGELEKAK